MTGDIKIDIEMDLYFSEVEKAFQKASYEFQVPETYNFKIAKYSVRLSLAGTKLYSVFFLPLSHLNVAENGLANLLVSVWDERETGVTLPVPPWQWADVRSPKSISQITQRGFSATLSEQGSVLTLYDSNSQKGIIWVRDADRLPNYFRAAPLFRIMRLWVRHTTLRFIHAGCIGDDAGALLLVGAGGSGKSTTSLLCGLAGLNYLSDDYILVDYGKTSMAYSIYNSGKLHKSHLLLFPELEKVAENFVPDEYGKSIIYLTRYPNANITRQSVIKAVVAPKVTGLTNSRIVPISAFDAIKALAPSTLIQLNTGDPGAFAAMSDLVRKIPCFQIQLGTDMTQIPVLIRHLLKKLQSYNENLLPES